MQRLTMIRHSKPSHLDQAKYGTLCRVNHSYSGDYELYIQVGKQQESPQWELVGLFNNQSQQDYVDQLVDMRMGIKNK